MTSCSFFDSASRLPVGVLKGTPLFTSCEQPGPARPRLGAARVRVRRVVARSGSAAWMAWDSVPSMAFTDGHRARSRATALVWDGGVGSRGGRVFGGRRTAEGGVFHVQGPFGRPKLGVDRSRFTPGAGWGYSRPGKHERLAA